MYNYITYRCYTATRHCPCTYVAVISWAVSLPCYRDSQEGYHTDSVQHHSATGEESSSHWAAVQSGVHPGQSGGQDLHLWWDDTHLVWLWEDWVLVHVASCEWTLCTWYRVWCSEWSFISHDTDHLLIWGLQSYYTMSKYILYCRMRK